MKLSDSVRAQLRYLYENQDKLSKTIQVNNNILHALESRKILQESDLAHLNNCNVSGNGVLASELTRILAVREGGLRALFVALFHDKQVKAVRLLINGLVEEDPEVSRIGKWALEYNDGKNYSHEPEEEEDGDSSGQDTDEDDGENSEEYPSYGKRTRFDGLPNNQRGGGLGGNFAKKIKTTLKSWTAPCFGQETVTDEESLIESEGGDFSMETSSVIGQEYQPHPTKVPGTNAWYYYTQESLLGCGPTACVYRGWWNDDQKHQVAIKVVRRSKCILSSSELSIAQEIWSERSKSINVVPVLNWSSSKDDEIMYYIVMELGVGTLKSAVVNSQKAKHLCPKENSQKCFDILQNCTDGLQWLHNDKNIIHRDIKPSNILLFEYSGKMVAKLGDFGVSRRVTNEDGTMSFVRGTERWMSPEALNALSNETSFENTKKMDIFSLGMVFHYCLTGGTHPFDFDGKILTNIKSSTMRPLTIENRNQFQFIAADNLLQWMMQKDPELRPTITQVGKHPMFWDEIQCLNFIEDVSRSFYNKDLKERQHLDQLYRNYFVARYNKKEFDWIGNVDPHFFKRLDNNRKKCYKTDSLISLVELIRDKAEHHADMVPELKNTLFGDLNGVYDKKAYALYFMTRYPDIVIFLFGTLYNLTENYSCVAQLKNDYFKEFQDSCSFWNEKCEL